MEERTSVTIKRGKETRVPTQGSGLPPSSTKLNRIVSLAEKSPNMVWNNLFHALDVDLFRQCFHDLPKDKAVGADKVSKEMYKENLHENLANLVECIKKCTYVPKPARVVNIPKADGTLRPLAVSCIEDKIVQSGLKRILEAIYEPKFLDCSQGFRPGLGCDTALKMLNGYLFSRSCGSVIDIDLKSFFNSIPHNKLLKLLGMHIQQPDFISLITKTMCTPLLNKNGDVVPNTIGVPQGSIVSPILANIYLHYAIDIWFQALQKTGVYGKCYMVRYADDAIFIFEDTETAKRFMQALIQRLMKFGIELNVDKTLLTPNGRKYVASCIAAKRKLPMFTFLGFDHIWKLSKSRRTGKSFWRPAVKSCPKRMKKKLQEAKMYIKKNRHHENLVGRTRQVVKGIAGYFCVNDNLLSVQRFSNKIKHILFKWLNKRGGPRMSWEDYLKILEFSGYPARFRVKNLFYDMKGS